jgi:hypothetical protein
MYENQIHIHTSRPCSFLLDFVEPTIQARYSRQKEPLKLADRLSIAVGRCVSFLWERSGSENLRGIPGSLVDCYVCAFG